LGTSRSPASDRSSCFTFDGSTLSAASSFSELRLVLRFALLSFAPSIWQSAPLRATITKTAWGDNEHKA